MAIELRFFSDWENGTTFGPDPHPVRPASSTISPRPRWRQWQTHMGVLPATYTTTPFCTERDWQATDEARSWRRAGRLTVITCNRPEGPFCNRESVISRERNLPQHGVNCARRDPERDRGAA